MRNLVKKSTGNTNNKASKTSIFNFQSAALNSTQQKCIKGGSGDSVIIEEMVEG